MSLEVQLTNLAIRAASESKSIRTLLNGNNASLSALTTTNKTSLVASINELVSLIGSAGAAIDDAGLSAGSVWSSSKTSTVIADAAAAVKADILGGAGSAFDTLKELEVLLTASETTMGGFTAALGNRLRFDTAQSLTAPQMAQVNANAGSLSLLQAGNPEKNFVATFESALI